MPMSVALPLAGVRVLAVEVYGAGPYGTMHLADLGAEVIKIEPPTGGDMARGVGPFRLGPDDSQFFQSFNRNKRSLTLDLKTLRGRRILERLVGTADILVNNLRGDQPGKLRLTHADFAAHNPRLVCGHLSGYGRTGSRAHWPGYDYLLQAETGWLHLTGEPDGPPTRVGLSLVDYMAGVTLAFAVTAALVRALRTGRGGDVDVSLYDVALHQLTYPALWYLNERHVTERRPRSGHPATVPVELFPTADGWIFLMCVTQKFWEELARRCARPDLLDDPRFADADARRRHRDALVETLDATLRTRTTGDWMQRFQGAVPAAPVLTLAEALDAPFAAERGLVQPAPHPLRPNLRLLGGAIRIDDRLPEVRAGPALGADTDAILGELGLSGAEIAALRADGVV
jgi:crotonobetainyl-CoA:carnitine CoA-transferase CaiB-like acyl-CoA transferase